MSNAIQIQGGNGAGIFVTGGSLGRSARIMDNFGWPSATFRVTDSDGQMYAGRSNAYPSRLDAVAAGIEWVLGGRPCPVDAADACEAAHTLRKVARAA